MSMVKNPEYGDLMPLQEFIECVEAMHFIPYDGDGCYSDGEMMDRQSCVWNGLPPPKWATHVMWFNC